MMGKYIDFSPHPRNNGRKKEKTSENIMIKQLKINVKANNSQPHRIHVWYIYLHLP